jgi:hypothetical protein
MSASAARGSKARQAGGSGSGAEVDLGCAVLIVLDFKLLLLGVVHLGRGHAQYEISPALLPGQLQPRT